MSADSGTRPASCRECPAWEKSAFARVSAASLATLDQEKELVRHERGETLTQQGSPADRIYCLCSGSAKVTYHHHSARTESVLRIVAPGDLAGYRCIFSAETFLATASALEPTVSCRISKATVLRLIERDPVFAFEMLRKMGEEIHGAERRLHSFCHKGARERTAEALLLLARTLGEREGNEAMRFPMLLTRTDLAHMVGTTKETMIRTLTDLRDEGLLEEDGEFARLPYPDRLRTVAGSPAP